MDSNSPKLNSQSWTPEGSFLSGSNITNFLFENAGIHQYLYDQKQFFIAANKGMGKTTLQTFKRYIISKNESLTIIPKSRPYLDFMSHISGLSKKFYNFFEDLERARELWELSIKISIFSYLNIKVRNLAELKKVNSDYASWIENNSQKRPTEVFSEIMHKNSPSKISQLCKNFILNSDFADIKEPIYIFIDKVDQALRDQNMTKNAWINIQVGLIEGAFNILQSNNHIKVYANVRQEAYANYESHTKNNLDGSTLILKYSNDELFSIMNKLCHYYENKGFIEYLGVEEIFNNNAFENEEIFKYMVRHSLGRPRDLVLISSKISQSGIKGNKDSLKRIINETCERRIIPNVFSEVSVFIKCLNDKEKRNQFFRLIPYNVLDQDDVKYIWSKFNNVGDLDIKDIDEDELTNSYYNPFSELVKLGLLGYLQEFDQNQYLQKFRTPDDLQEFDSPFLPRLRGNSLYFIHPSLNELIKSSNNYSNYYIFKYFLIGNLEKWNYLNTKLMEIQKYILKIDDSLLQDQMFYFLSSNIGYIKNGDISYLKNNYESLVNDLSEKLSNNQLFECCFQIESLMSDKFIFN